MFLPHEFWGGVLKAFLLIYQCSHLVLVFCLVEGYWLFFNICTFIMVWDFLFLLESVRWCFVFVWSASFHPDYLTCLYIIILRTLIIFFFYFFKVSSNINIFVSEFTYSCLFSYFLCQSSCVNYIEFSKNQLWKTFSELFFSTLFHVSPF